MPTSASLALTLSDHRYWRLQDCSEAERRWSTRALCALRAAAASLNSSTVVRRKQEVWIGAQQEPAPDLLLNA